MYVINDCRLGPKSNFYQHYDRFGRPVPDALSVLGDLKEINIPEYIKALARFKADLARGS